MDTQSIGARAHYDYNDPNSYSYEQAALVLRKLGLNNDAMEQLYRRMGFNVLAKKQDDHVKNIPFLMDRKRQWCLAPAYDMTLSYLPGYRWLGAHQMSINGKRTEITEKDLLTRGTRMDMTAAKCRRIIQRARHWYSYPNQTFLLHMDEEHVKHLITKE